MMNTTINRQSNKVKYNEGTRLWLLNWPGGPEGHRRAILANLERTMPEVVDELRNLLYKTRKLENAEAIASRAIKAAFIIQDGKVWPPRSFTHSDGCINEIARVESSEASFYIISFDGEEAHCDCMDFQRGNAPVLPSGQLACKHIIATLVTEAVKAEKAGSEVEVDF